MNKEEERECKEWFLEKFKEAYGTGMIQTGPLEWTVKEGRGIIKWEDGIGMTVEDAVTGHRNPTLLSVLENKKYWDICLRRGILSYLGTPGPDQIYFAIDQEGLEEAREEYRDLGDKSDIGFGVWVSDNPDHEIMDEDPITVERALKTNESLKDFSFSMESYLVYSGSESSDPDVILKEIRDILTTAGWIEFVDEDEDEDTFSKEEEIIIEEDMDREQLLKLLKKTYKAEDIKEINRNEWTFGIPGVSITLGAENEIYISRPGYEYMISDYDEWSDIVTMELGHPDNKFYFVIPPEDLGNSNFSDSGTVTFYVYTELWEKYRKENDWVEEDMIIPDFNEPDMELLIDTTDFYNLFEYEEGNFICRDSGRFKDLNDVKEFLEGKGWIYKEKL